MLINFSKVKIFGICLVFLVSCTNRETLKDEILKKRNSIPDLKLVVVSNAPISRTLNKKVVVQIANMSDMKICIESNNLLSTSFAFRDQRGNVVIFDEEVALFSTKPSVTSKKRVVSSGESLEILRTMDLSGTAGVFTETNEPIRDYIHGEPLTWQISAFLFPCRFNSMNEAISNKQLITIPAVNGDV